MAEPSDSRRKAVDAVLSAAVRWAQGEPRIAAIGLTGSWARGTARADSDVDLIVLAADPDTLLAEQYWFGSFGDNARLVRSERFGSVTERRLRLASGLEVEVCIGPREWAAKDPIDEGTRRLVSDGFRILYDPDFILAALVEASS